MNRNPMRQGGPRPGGHGGGPRPGGYGGPRGHVGGRHGGPPPPPPGFRRRRGCLGPGCLMALLPIVGIIAVLVFVIGILL